MFDDLPELLESLGVKFDGRDFANMDWLENEQTCGIIHDRCFSIAMEAIDPTKREQFPKNIDHYALFALGRACAQLLDDRNRGLESPIATLALHRYIESLVHDGEPDVFFEQQCRLRLITTDLLINYTTFRDDISADGMVSGAICHRFLEHSAIWFNNISQLIESIQLIGNQEQPLNFGDQNKRDDTVFDYYICLAQAVRSLMLQFSFLQPIMDLETATNVLNRAAPLIVQSIQTLAPHREESSVQYILFQAINAHMGIFMGETTVDQIPVESMFDQCNRASVYLENLSPADVYATLFTHVLRVKLCTQHEQLNGHLEQVKTDAMNALEASAQVRHYEAYRMIIEHLCNGEEFNNVILSDQLAHAW